MAQEQVQVRPWFSEDHLAVQVRASAGATPEERPTTAKGVKQSVC